MPTISQEEAVKMGIPHETLQTIELPKRKFNLRQAKKWLRENNYVNTYYRTTLNFYRFMQVFPIRNASYHSKELSNGVILVYQKY